VEADSPMKRVNREERKKEGEKERDGEGEKASIWTDRHG